MKNSLGESALPHLKTKLHPHSLLKSYIRSFSKQTISISKPINSNVKNRYRFTENIFEERLFSEGLVLSKGMLTPKNCHFPVENWLDLRVKSGLFTSKELALYTYKYPSTAIDRVCRGIVYLFHCYGSYIPRDYLAIASKLAASGYLCLGFDQRGMGRSQGLRGYNFSSFF
jgi:hypothetical protein